MSDYAHTQHPSNQISIPTFHIHITYTHIYIYIYISHEITITVILSLPLQILLLLVYDFRRTKEEIGDKLGKKKEMMAKLLVSPTCLSLSLVNRPQSPNCRRCMPASSPSVATSRFQLPKRRRRIIGTEDRNSSFNWMATVGGNAESTAVPTSVPVRVAHELLQAGHRYLDVRTVEEFSAGHAAGAINVPYLFRVGSGMTKNPNFLEEVLSHFAKDDEIIVGCQLGKRSLMAATDLLSAGFTGVTDIAGGYAAWTQNGLPIES